MKLPLELTAVTILSVLLPMVLPNSALPIIFTTPGSSQRTEPGPPRISTVFLDHGIAAREYGSLPRSISPRSCPTTEPMGPLAMSTLTSVRHTLCGPLDPPHHVHATRRGADSHHDKSRLMETSCGTPSVLTHGNLVGNTHSVSTHGNLMGNTFAVSTYENFVGRMASPSDRSLEETILIKGDTFVTVTVKAQLSNSHRLLTMRVRCLGTNNYIIVTRTRGMETERLSMTAYVHLPRKFVENTCIQEVARTMLALARVSTLVSPCLPEGLFQALSVLDAVTSYAEV
ncbi:hypothetical protein F4604DRAFT_1672911 [Suillus subluteus]|nr:hypothetical protein F4604DRAFT_1672911 [Suillus subluteus]